MTIVALAIGLPRTNEKTRSSSSTLTSPARTRAGTRKSRITSQAPSLHSALKSGSMSATHSPHPSASSVSTRARMQTFSVDVPKLVRNGRTSGSPTSRSSIARTRVTRHASGART